MYCLSAFFWSHRFHYSCLYTLFCSKFLIILDSYHTHTEHKQNYVTVIYILSLVAKLVFFQFCIRCNHTIFCGDIGVSMYNVYGLSYYVTVTYVSQFRVIFVFTNCTRKGSNIFTVVYG